MPLELTDVPFNLYDAAWTAAHFLGNNDATDADAFVF